MPKASDLPDSLKGLARRQATEISPARFDADVEKLTSALVRIEDELRQQEEAEAWRAPHEERRQPKGEWDNRTEAAPAKARRTSSFLFSGPSDRNRTPWLEVGGTWRALAALVGGVILLVAGLLLAEFRWLPTQGQQNGIHATPQPTAPANYIVQVNDLFPQSAAIIASLKKQNIQLSGTFGSTSLGNRTKPDKLVIVVGPNFPIDVLQQIIRICLDNGLDGLQLSSDQRETNTAVIGSFAYEGYTQINEQIKSKLLSSSLTWPQLIQLVAVSSPNYIVQVNDLFPQSAQIIASLKKQNIQLSGTFGSTSIGNRTKPDKFVTAIGPQFPIDTFQRIFRVCIENGLDGLKIISGEPNFYSIYIGSFAYEPYTPITEQLKSDLLSSGLTWAQLEQLVIHADQ